MKVGLFGGSFNPIHTGHLIVINSAIEQLELDQIYVMPAACNPFKMDSTDMAPANDRLAMARLAVNGMRLPLFIVDPKVVVSDMEIKRGAPSYTIDTVRELKRVNDDVTLIVGADSYEEIGHWHQIDELKKMVTFGVAQRHLHGKNSTSLMLYHSIKTTSIDIPTFDTSGTEVRSRIKAGRSIQYLVPDAVEEYIRNNGLYLTSK